MNLPFLDLERRTGVKNQDIDDFLSKVNAVDEAIKGLKVNKRLHGPAFQLCPAFSVPHYLSILSIASLRTVRLTRLQKSRSQAS